MGNRLAKSSRIAALRGIHFRYQYSYADSEGEGKRLIPDFIIDLPNSRSIVVDSKLSLVDYVDYCSAEDAAAKKFRLRNLKSRCARTYRNFPEIQ
ncbi:MAG: DNA recombination protein RmuC [Bacilli bacterium]